MYVALQRCGREQQSKEWMRRNGKLVKRLIKMPHVMRKMFFMTMMTVGREWRSGKRLEMKWKKKKVKRRLNEPCTEQVNSCQRCETFCNDNTQFYYQFSVSPIQSLWNVQFSDGLQTDNMECRRQWTGNRNTHLIKCIVNEDNDIERRWRGGVL